MRVLVVDDSRAMRMIVARAMREAEGVTETLEADSAEAAIEVLGAEPVDLVLCDWNMGGMTGVELLEALRAAGWTVPFGFVTSESSEEICARALGAGAAFLMAKPFDAAELAVKVAAVLGGGEVAVTGGGASGGEDREVALRHLLENLLHKPVSVAPASAGPTRQDARWRAGYVDPAGDKVAFCVVETALASAMSAALTLMPPSTAKEWASSGTLPDVLEEGFHEVTNVIAKTVRVDGIRCILAEVAGFAPGEQLPEIELVRAAACQESFEVSVEGYGSGLLSLVSL